MTVSLSHPIYGNVEGVFNWWYNVYMINTIKKILDFDISDDKKLDLIRALIKENNYTYSNNLTNGSPMQLLNATYTGESVQGGHGINCRTNN